MDMNWPYFEEIRHSQRSTVVESRRVRIGRSRKTWRNPVIKEAVRVGETRQSLDRSGHLEEFYFGLRS